MRRRMLEIDRAVSTGDEVLNRRSPRVDSSADAAEERPQRDSNPR
jgi:hypothetical protein